MEDQRLISRLISYWERICSGGSMPRWEQFNATTIEDLWQQCCAWKVDIGGKSPSYTYEYVGKGIKGALGIDPTGTMFTTHFRNFPGARIVREIDTLVTMPKPLKDESQFVNEQSKVVKYRSCLLPFGNKKRLTHVVLGLSWKAF